MSVGNAELDERHRHHQKKIDQAAARIRDHIVVTPCEQVTEWLWLKREDLQLGGSFKTRGVASVLLDAPDDVRARGAVCVSSGNTALALARLSGSWGLRCHAFVPAHADHRKVRSIAEAGASVIVSGGSFADATAAAYRFAQEKNLVFCSPGRTWAFAYGVGTAGAEIARQLSGLERVYLPVGGGGLATGIGLALSALPPNRRPRLVGVQVRGSPFVYEFFHHGRITSTRGEESVADALIGDLEPGATILEVARDVLSDVILVSDAEIIAAQRWLLDRGISVEPSAAAGLAGAIRTNEGDRGRCCVLLTGTMGDR
ncbi:hypothetical protein GCM10029978_095380 [Actinoallomurus acanthiterrae]